MTTRSRQKLSSILAVFSIVALLLLLLFVWTAVRNGVFSNANENGSYRWRPIDTSDSSTLLPLDEHSTHHHSHGHHHAPHHHHHHQHNESTTSHGGNSTEFEVGSSSTSSSTHHHNHTASKQLHETIPDDVDLTEVDQLVKPSKVHVQPLHADDLLYESTKYEPGADVEGKVPEHRITGQYRNKSSRIWDPHPQYLIDAFGVHLHLILYQDNDFIPKHLKITHVWNNFMERKVEDIREHEELRNCFYRGRVRTDDRSAVAVSLCDGMRGHIYTSSGSFFIQPVEKYTLDNQNILHKITREKLPIDQVSIDTYRNGKVLVDEIGLHEDDDEKIDEDDELNQEIEDELDSNESILSETTTNNGTDNLDAPIVTCTSEDGKNCSEDNQTSATESWTSSTESVDSSTMASFMDSTQQMDDLEDFTLEPTESTEGTESATDFETTTTKTTTSPPRLSRRKRHINFPSSNTGDNNAYTMEVMVAVDRKMHEYHGNNIQEYVLTLMSIVSNIYADASIGNSINVAVVHIFYLRDDLHMESNHNGVSASQMLSRFCKFVQHHQFHHDTALLLTREQICRNANQKKCDTLGLAELGTMCRPSSCAIVQDNGLSAAFTIAHELGHVLSMPHDDDIKCARFRNEDGSSSQHIMARMLDDNTHPWSWSACSRHYVTEYLEHNRGFCMLNKPRHDMIESSPQLLAGERFPADQQCELAFGPNTKVCPFSITVSILGRKVDQPPCVSLWCGSDNEGCKTQHLPWADGTECGTGHWCQHGKCVPRNRQALTKVDGGWGPWNSFDQCSRTCGGGVQSSTRECDSPAPSNGGKYCIGTRIKYRSCNIHDCPADTPDFREQQCAEMNNNNFGIQGLDANVRWVPKYGQSPHDECKLYCRVEKSNNYFLLNDKVKDGTPCSHDSFHKCVNGICRPAGCNNQLDSDSKLDKCGVCNGNNDTCIDIVGNFRPEQIEKAKEYSKTRDYYHVTIIPKGAANIEILQPGYSNDLNYIALMDDQGEYIFNGHNVITEYPLTFPYGGVTFEYTGTNSTLEKVNTTFARRLKRDLTIEILSRSDNFVTNELIRYSYTMDLNETRNTHVHFYPYNYNQNQNSNSRSQQQQPSARQYPTQTVQYKWEMSQWSECNILCDGEQFRTAACVQIDTGRHVSPSSCREPKPEDEYQPCNVGCVVEWEIQRTKCSAECGEGVQQLSYSCIQTFPQSNHRKVVDDSHCPTSQKSKLYEKCMGPCASATWTYEEFGPCSKICNGGIQSRTAYCTSHHRGHIIDDKYCANIQRESLERACNTHECPKWQFGDESACSVTCGSGYKTRSAICVQNNKVVNVNECDAKTKPKDIYSSCQLEPCWRKNPTPTPVLYSRDNSPNIITSYRNRIDTGVKPSVTYRTTPTRKVYTTTTITTTTPAPTTRSTTTTTTTTTTTPKNTYPQPRQSYRFLWRTSRWSPCSATCDGGYRIRAVRCVSESSNQVVDDRYCVEEKPVNITNCAQQRCPKWRTGDWGQCNDNCKQYRQVICQDDRHHANITNCPLNTRPLSTQECCQFKWRNLWTPCSAECGNGTRSRQRVCMRLYPRVQNAKTQVRKKGQPVGERYCQHMKQPPFIPKMKVCRKQACAAPKWEVTPWTRCSVGCGKGYSTREVKCMLSGTKVNELMCGNQAKPIATQHCEITSDCKWKAGPWKPCSCSGYTKRRVQCFDMRLHRQSNSCPDANKPDQKKRCDQPATCTCKGLQKTHRVKMDGDYLLTVRGRKVQIYCHRMNSTNPQEYISLRDDHENYSLYFDRRSRNKDECSVSESQQWMDPSLASGLTYFSKVRIDLHSLQVIIDDFTFARTSGRRQQPFGSAGDCFSTTQQCPRGAFSINLENTKFRIRPKTRWETRGMNAIQHFYGFEPPYQKVTSSCGGYCGSCFPSRDTGLHLEVI
ncbi:A disintegrin and metalloproteinase with thrombospondin motifs 9-like isoform X3 [Sitodiplosis mosellana]|uniref:A disintegrin and metalloproteinase with thrombospondin motifs 9-like isoform X3 n=1 Tax=Sitodiplosis mosellana TaxID=263140 RepID=UPI002444B643|nr:A disintegrin and metalloproteinase with thrombospondin motifs 9-like isoform X3 [Sitodiplosis mosellana]